jgi:hypothetical protein
VLAEVVVTAHQHVVMWSGGITSWAVALKVVEKHGTENVTLLFADTKYEDEDLYRWNDEASAQLGVPLTVVADGRTPWEVFHDKRYIGNTRIAPCSELLKAVPCADWLAKKADPASTTIYMGIDWSETHRVPAIRSGYAHTAAGCAPVKVDGKSRRLCSLLFTDEGRLPGPGCRNLLPIPWQVEAPLTEAPFHDKDFWLAEAARLGLKPPRLYGLGWEHNNCGGRCIKGGQAQWAHLLKVFPERYAEVEVQEEAMRTRLGADVAFLRDRRGGTTKPLPLALLRTRLEGDRAEQPGLFDADDWGGCGCLPDGQGDAADGPALCPDVSCGWRALRQVQQDEPALAGLFDSLYLHAAEPLLADHYSAEVSRALHLAGLATLPVPHEVCQSMGWLRTEMAAS